MYFMKVVEHYYVLGAVSGTRNTVLKKSRQGHRSQGACTLAWEIKV